MLSPILWWTSLLLLLLAAPLGTASPAPSTRHVVHEKRDAAPPGWVVRDRLAGTTRLPLRIGLRQRNLERGAAFLDEVSNPRSAKYARHWTAEQVMEAFSPSQDTIAAVTSWLVTSGIEPHQFSLTPGNAWVEVNATVAEAEALLQTEYHIYEHGYGAAHVACQSYRLPEELSARHVDIVLPSVHFDAKLSPPRRGSPRARARALEKRQQEADDDDLAPQPVPVVSDSGGGAKNVGTFNSSLPKPGEQINIQAVALDTSTCDQYIVPDCLRLLYNFSSGTLDGSSYGIVEYTPQAYLPADLDLFFTNFSSDLVGQRPIFDSVDGGELQTIVESFSYNGESDLDLEYAMALVAPQAVTLYQVGDLVEGASFNNFLDAIDGSFCTFEGGDDAIYDAPYPDPSSGGYKAKDCGNYTATAVISTSYGYNEVDLTPAYEERQCAEYMKLGLQGVTVLYSSGDNGVAGNSGQCLDADGTLNDGSSGAFAPSFPGGCPYVTSVGATQVPTGVDVSAAIASGTQPETASETVIYSGGGFSNVFALPDYQADAVKSYLTNYPPPYTSAQYNNSGTSRAFPDISANGANYVVAVDGSFSLVYGTSASSPVVGSIITLINEQLAAAGKSPVGFINPVLYANPDVLNDITNGTNPGCGTSGFSTEPGWDPVTGLGTPNYEKMLALFLSLQ